MQLHFHCSCYKSGNCSKNVVNGTQQGHEKKGYVPNQLREFIKGIIEMERGTKGSLPYKGKKKRERENIYIYSRDFRVPPVLILLTT